MRISDWSSDVCSSDLHEHEHTHDEHPQHAHADPVSPGATHRHRQSHEPLTHTHEHFPDAHHRHKHLLCVVDYLYPLRVKKQINKYAALITNLVLTHTLTGYCWLVPCLPRTRPYGCGHRGHLKLAAQPKY